MRKLAEAILEAYRAAYSKLPPPKFRGPSPKFCPFCGGTCGIYGDLHILCAHVYCARCWARGPVFHDKDPRSAMRKAVRHWNKRAKRYVPPPPDHSRHDNYVERDVQ
jgi:hypothetical protein